MADELRTPPEEPPLRVIEHGGFFELYKPPPKHVIGTVDGATYTVIYDGQSEPRLTVDFDGFRVRIDAETATVVEGGIADEELGRALEYAEDNTEALAAVWSAMHESFASLQVEAGEIASELTDPNDIEVDEE